MKTLHDDGALQSKKNGAVLAPLNFPEGKSHGTAIEIAA